MNVNVRQYLSNYQSWEHMDHDEHMAWLVRPLSRWSKIQIKLRKMKWAFNTWRQLRQLDYECKHEDPKGGADEVLFLRSRCTLEPEHKTQA
jgi:hypothetical protein